jgi:tetratricopeptide (TPR) repeat protein
VNYEEIEKYLHGELEADEKKAFEQAMASDKALAAEVTLYQQTEQQLLGKASAVAGEAQLTQQLNRLNKEYFGAKDEVPVINIKKRKRLYYYIGGAAAALLAIFLLQPLLHTQKSADELYADNAGNIYSFGSTARSGKSSEPDAVALFTAKKYREALAILEPISTNNADTLLAKAVCYVETGNTDKALEIYNGLAAVNNYTNKANLHKAMLYLKKGDKAACRKALEQIPKDADQYDTAAKLLKEL